jgi:hypothetical protein
MPFPLLELITTDAKLPRELDSLQTLSWTSGPDSHLPINKSTSDRLHVRYVTPREEWPDQPLFGFLAQIQRREATCDVLS